MKVIKYFKFLKLFTTDYVINFSSPSDFRICSIRLEVTVQATFKGLYSHQQYITQFQKDLIIFNI